MYIGGSIYGFIPFYIAHWEEYYANILVLGKVINPTEAQLFQVRVLSKGQPFASAIFAPIFLFLDRRASCGILMLVNRLFIACSAQCAVFLITGFFGRDLWRTEFTIPFFDISVWLLERLHVSGLSSESIMCNHLPSIEELTCTGFLILSFLILP